MDIFSVLTMFGGLALFLYGMHAMGEGLNKVANGKLEKVLESLTSSPLRAVALGAAVTAVVQSSSATTVMVVGFVNSGIMKLGQAVGIIMGANIGTTITSWVLSLAGIESGNFFIKMLKPTSFSPILAVIGIFFLLFCKSEKKKDVGNILIGFAILMFGMDTMSTAVKPLADVPAFTNLFVMFSNPILGMIVGALLTAVIQSSSASVGILQALCVTGSVSYSAAMPIIMGQNIGTCVTAMLSSVGASKNAKRAALIHLYFNLLGTIVFMAGFYAIHAVVDFSFMGEAASAAGIAIIHTTFNIVATVLLLPFAKVLEKLAYMTIKEDKEEANQVTDGLQVLDVRFLEEPAFATQQCKSVAEKMVVMAKEALYGAIDLVYDYSTEKAEEIRNIEKEVDRYEDELGNYLIRLSSKPMTEKDNRTVMMLLHCMGDFERISDLSMNIVKAAREKQEKKIEFSEVAVAEITVYSNAVKEIVDKTMTCFATEDVALAEIIEPLEEVIDHLNSETKRRHIKRLRKGQCTMELGFVLADITTNYERIADHCANIGVCLIQLSDDSYEPHEYVKQLEKGENSLFHDTYLEYMEKYELA